MDMLLSTGIRQVSTIFKKEEIALKKIIRTLTYFSYIKRSSRDGGYVQVKFHKDEIVYKKIISNKMENKRIYLAKKEKKLLSVKLS